MKYQRRTESLETEAEIFSGCREGRRDRGAAGAEGGRQAGVGEEQAGGLSGQHGARAGVLQEDEHLPGFPRDGKQEDLATC